VFVVGAGCTHLHRLSNAVSGDEQEKAWSPDSTQLAVGTLVRGVETVAIYDLASGRARAVTPKGSSDSDPHWSPDGRWLLVARSLASAALVGDLWAIPTGVGDPVQITHSHDIEFDPRWF
jgi:Tol biopolymer transport system component